jgi:hypothetical protein
VSKKAVNKKKVFHHAVYVCSRTIAIREMTDGKCPCFLLVEDQCICVVPLSFLSSPSTKSVEVETRKEKHKDRIVTKESNKKCMRTAQMVKLVSTAVSVIETTSAANNDEEKALVQRK